MRLHFKISSLMFKNVVQSGNLAAFSPSEVHGVDKFLNSSELKYHYCVRTIRNMEEAPSPNPGIVLNQSCRLDLDRKLHTCWHFHQSLKTAWRRTFEVLQSTNIDTTLYKNTIQNMQHYFTINRIVFCFILF